MALPDFVIIGSPKAGTTALHAALVRHPDLFMCSPKEPKFFMTDGPPRRRDQRGPGDAHSAGEWVWSREGYESLFDPAPESATRGEATPFYLWDRRAHKRMAEVIPRARLIAVIRDPVDRAFSNWMHLRADGLEPVKDFLAACRLEASRRDRGWAPFWRYLELGRYGEQLAHLHQYFPPEQVHIVRYRDVVEEPVATLRAVCEFLGVAPVLTEVPHANVGRWAAETPANEVLRRAVRAGAALGSFGPPHVWRKVEKPMLKGLQRGTPGRPRVTLEQRAALLPAFADDIALLERLTGQPFQDWLAESGQGSFAGAGTATPSAASEAALVPDPTAVP